MAENDIAQVAENQPEKTRREAFMERFGQRWPDVDAADEEAFYGRLSDELDRIDRSDAAQKELGELLASDPRSAGFLMVMRKGGNPIEYLIEQYGDDFREALNDEAKAKEFSEAFSKYAEKQAKDKELQAQAESNMQRMLDDLDAAKAEGSFTDEDAAKAYSYLYGDGGLLDRIITNDISKDDWMMLMKAANYDLMTASQTASYRGTASPVQFQFEHLLSRVSIAGRAENGNVTINSITLTGVSESGSYDSASGWSGLAAGNGFTASNIQLNGTTADVIGNKLMIPQPVGGMEVSVNYKPDGASASLSATYELPVTEFVSSWEPGRSYRYTFVVYGNRIIFDKPTVTAWDDATGGIIVVE